MHWGIGIGIGDQVLDLRAAASALGAWHPQAEQALQSHRLNELFALGRPAQRALRHAAWSLLLAGSRQASNAAAWLVPQADATFGVPCEIGDYTDFFSSLNHAMNTFRLFRPGQTFLPNFKHLPIAYHGRASSLVPSGTGVMRPRGQFMRSSGEPPAFGPTRKMDHEVELGFFIGEGNRLGESIAIDRAEQHLAGVCLLNDWSARDLQAWESQPLGPFLSKNFLSTVSPWVVTLDAMAPFRAQLAARTADDPPPLDYLHSADNEQQGAFEIHIETRLQTASMRASGVPALTISRARLDRDAWWTPAQMLAHHTVNGCNMRPGDLIGTGTISGPDEGTQGCLLELTHGGARPLSLANGETRSFLEDGDELTLVAWCEREGRRRIGLGRCVGRIDAPTGAST